MEKGEVFVPNDETCSTGQACNVTLEDRSEVTVLAYNPAMPKTVVESEASILNLGSDSLSLP